MAHITIPNTDPRISYTATGGTAFSIPFPFFSTDDIKVYLDGVLQTTAYTITGTAVDGGYASGTCTFTTAPPSNTVVILTRDIAISRTTDFPYPSRALDIEGLNTEIDRLTAISRDARRLLNLALRVSESETPPIALPLAAVRANRMLAFDSNGAPYAANNPGLGGGIVTGMGLLVATATGDGTTDDTAAINAALATGNSIFLPPGTYKVTSALNVAAPGQRIVGAGRHQTTIKPVGSFNLFNITGAYGCGVEHLYVLGTSHSGGRTFFINGASRTLIQAINLADAYNVAYVTNANMTVFRDLYGTNCRGTETVKLYGPGATRSDAVVLDNCIFSANATDKPTGLDWDGFVHSVWIIGGGFLSGHGKGIWVRNAAAGSAEPAFLQAFSPTMEAVDTGMLIDAGTYFDLHGPYISLIAGDGIKTAVGIAGDMVTLYGGLVQNCTGYGINSQAGVTNAIGTRFFNNTSGDTAAVMRIPTKGIRIDPAAYWEMTGGNPTMVMDVNDFYNYDRAANAHQWWVGGTLEFQVTTNGIRVPAMPTSSGGLTAGTLWNDGGTVKVA